MSIDADAIATTSIFREVVGTTIEKIRIATATHDTCIGTASGPSLHAFITPIANALTSMKPSPTSAFVLALCGAYRTYTYMPAEAAIASNSIVVNIGDGAKALGAARRKTRSRSSPNVHSAAATAENSPSRCTRSSTNPSGSWVVDFDPVAVDGVGVGARGAITFSGWLMPCANGAGSPRC